MTLRELELELKIELEAAKIADPGFETRQILSSLMKINTWELLTHDQREVDLTLWKEAHRWVSERLRGVPLAYLTGKKGFYKHEFLIEPGVLVPRPETEHVIEVALQRVGEQNLQVKNLIDLGCGSGILAVSLAHEFRNARSFAIDASNQAVVLTQRNAEKVGVQLTAIVSRVEDFVSALHGVRFDLVAANPPYIAKGDPLVQPSVHAHEPHAALYADENGLAAIRAWSQWAFANMNEGGVLVMEIGASQSAQAGSIMSGLGFKDIRFTKDLAGFERVISAVR